MDGDIPSQKKSMYYRVLLAGLILPVYGYAADISSFKVVDVNAYFALRYLYDENSLSLGNITSSQTKLPTFQEELQFDSKAYIYHPNLLELDFGGGLLFDQSKVEQLQGESSSNERLENYYLRMDFLKKKPYPFSFYYNKSNPSVATGLTERYIQENTKYGIDASLLQPFSPVQVNINAYHETFQGSSSDQIVNDIRDYGQLRLYKSYGQANTLQLTHTVNKLDSRSGNPNLPIQHRLFSQSSTNLNTKNNFGEKNQASLTNTITYNTQDEFPVRKEFTISPNLSWTHSESWRSFYRYSLYKKDEDILTTENQQFSLGLTHSDKPLSVNLDIHGKDNQTTGREAKSAGITYSLSYNKPVNDYKIGWGYSGSYDQHDQTASVNYLNIINEEHVLSGTTSVTLLNEFINPVTIDVKEFSGSAVSYIEGQDYRLIVIGSNVQLQRITTGTILDGQTVVVEYSYNSGGTYAYEILTQNINMNISFLKYYKFYSQYQFYQQTLLEGSPTLALNSISRISVGLTADRPLPNGMTVGGEILFVNNDEDISPNVKNSLDAFLEIPLPKLTTLRLSANHKKVDYDYSDEDVDLNGVALRISSQPWLRTSLMFESNYEKDTGGSIETLRQQHRLQFRWRIRQLTVDFNAKYILEQQGATVRDHRSVMFVAKRRF